MNSIDRQQPESNHADLAGDDAIGKIRSIAEDAKVCFFCTSLSTADTNGVRPMTVQEVDDEGNLWFLTADDSHNELEIEQSPLVRLLFQSSKYSGFMQLDGTAAISNDRKKIDDLWKPMMRTWFTDGKDDPRIRLIRVRPAEGYYWDNKHGNIVAGVKIAIGSLIRRTLDDSVQGKLDPKQAPFSGPH